MYALGNCSSVTATTRQHKTDELFSSRATEASVKNHGHKMLPGGVMSVQCIHETDHMAS